MLTQINEILDIPELNKFKIGDKVICESTGDYDRFDGIVIGIELRKTYGVKMLEPDITILHDVDLITDGFKPRDLILDTRK